ncbi:MAG: M50 family metallopeptidase [Acidobacteria bacterium]|nr:M50 family metallopeptidase [Acidobacteriota bacterium]
MANRKMHGAQVLILVSLFTVMLSFIPGASILTYPFRLFVTFIHEGGHALAAVLTGGSVRELRIHLDASGETYSLGGIPLLIASAGYLMSAIYGASLLVLCRDGRNAKAALTLTAAAILALTMFCAQGMLSVSAGLGIPIVLVFVALACKESWAHFFAMFLAIQCCLNALIDLRTLFLLSATTNVQSDAANMAGMTGVPALFWSLLWIGGSLFILWRALRTYGNPYAREVSVAAPRKRRAYANL